MIRPQTIGARLGIFNAILVLTALIGMGGAGLVAVDRVLIEGVDRVLIDELFDATTALSREPLEAGAVEAFLVEEAAEEHAGGYEVYYRVTELDGASFAASEPTFWNRVAWRRATAEPTHRGLQLDGEPHRIRMVAKVVETSRGPLQAEVALRLEPEDRAMASLFRAGAMAVPAVIVVAAVLGAFMARRALAPVDAIERTARTIGAGPRGRRLPATGANDELDRLAQTLNAMLDRLERTAMRNLAFAGDVAHEVRTPLAVLRTRLEEAQSHAVEGPSADALAHALGAADRLEGMVRSLLALARADEGGAPAEPRAPFDAAEVAAEVVTFFAPAAEARGMDLRLEAAPGSGPIVGDRIAFARAVANLVDNAITYAPAGTQVDVRVEAGEGSVALSVTDRGPTLDAQLCARLFERFVRGEQARALRPDGAGLGLSLVRAVASGLGGEADCAPGPGGGNVFRIRVPLAHP